MYTNSNGTALAVSGATQNWTILGGAGTQRTGTIKNDVFHSVNGDILVGGLGDDTYNLWDINSIVVEQAGEGIDTINVRFWGGIALPDNVENVVLMSPSATWATGNALDNIMIAGTAGATLDGGLGQDVLVGGAGADVFKITKGNGSDVVMNFQAGWDVIALRGYDLTFAQITANAVQVGNDVRIKLSATEGLLLRDIRLSSLGAADFNILDPVKAPAGYQTLSAAGEAVNYKGWYVLNNAWGAQNLVAGRDYTLTSSYSASDVTKGTTFNWSFEAKSHDLSILAFPEVAFGYSPFNTSGSNPSDTAHVFPIKVSEMVGLTADYDVSYQGNLAGFNVAFDIWLASSAIASSREVITNEVMVWLHKGAFKAYGELVGTYTKGDFTASIYHQGTYTALVADRDWTSGTLDIADIIKALQQLGIVNSSEYLRSVEFGAEVASGTGSLVIGNLDLRVETTNPAGGTIVKQVDGSGTTVTTVQSAEAPRPAPEPAPTPAPTPTPTPESDPLKAVFLAKYAPGSVATRDEYGAVNGSLKIKLLTESRAQVEHYDMSGKYRGVDIATTEKGTTIVEQHFDAANTLIDAVKTVYQTDGSIQTVSYNANWMVQSAIIRAVDAAGVSMTRHFDGNWGLVSMDRTFTKADGSIQTEHYDSAAKMTGFEVATIDRNVTKTAHYDAKGGLIETHTVSLMGNGTSKDLTHNAVGKIVDLHYYGTAKNDTIVGSAYTNHFHGGAGSDTLTAGKGKDFFHFDTPLSGGGVDTIVDFSKANDKIVLHSDIFSGLGVAGQLNAAAFVIGTAATDADDRIIYNAKNGSLFYDVDGTGAGAAVQIAVIHSDVALTLSNFIVM